MVAQTLMVMLVHQRELTAIARPAGFVGMVGSGMFGSRPFNSW